MKDAGIDFGYRPLAVGGARRGLRFSVRGTLVGLALLGSAVVIVVLAMGIGEFPVPADRVVVIVLGGGDDFDRLVVLEWRLPIALSALVLGALLGLGGAVFQSLTRNPLGSPDIIGFDTGAYTAVLVTMLLFGVRDYWAVAGAAVLGGLTVAALVYLLAFKQGVQGIRLIVVGIGLSSMLGAVNAYLITRADVRDAISVGFWAAGTLGHIGWSRVVLVTVVALALCLALAVFSPSLGQQELGDDAATVHGVRLNRDRLALVALGAGTSAAVTAAAGPIGFVALAAPQMAARLTRTSGVGLTTSACMGAALLSGAHLVSLLPSIWAHPVPVGLVTVCLGGCYFIVLLVRETRRRL